MRGSRWLIFAPGYNPFYSMRKIYLTDQSKLMLKSWVKVAFAASLAVYMTGSASFGNVVNAGLVAVLPVIHSWLDSSDKRFGRGSK